MSIMFLPLHLIPRPVQAIVIASTLDLLLSRKPELAAMLDPLEGRTFKITVRDQQNVFYLGFRQAKAWVHTEYQGDIDVEVEGSLSGFARLSFAKENPDHLVLQRALSLSGDSEVMLAFKNLLNTADFDWEAELRHGFGDYFGARVAKLAKSIIKLDQKASQHLQENLQQGLENIGTPNQRQLQQWQAGVESLQRKVQRLQQRIDRCERHMNKNL